ncbi:SagB/ThcOx family dehydrogenase [Flindersiella endophytica]
MSGNREISAARIFHDATKYVFAAGADGEEKLMMGTPPEVEEAIWEQDWSVEPSPYKVYTDRPETSIPREFPSSAMPALEAIAPVGTEVGRETPGAALPDRSVLARIGLLSNGLLNRTTQRRRGKTVEYRTAGGTGARYHLELYFVCADLPDLPAGVYHYDVPSHSLCLLRAGDFRAVLVSASGGEPAVAQAPVVLAMTSTFWRNAWRYKARAYRHTYWDAGTSFSHVLAVAASAGVPAKVVLGYSDAAVNALLGVDGVRESAIALCPLGSGVPAPAAMPSIEPLDYATKPISAWEVEFPHLTAMHAASMLDSAEEAASWREIALQRTPPEPQGPLIDLEPLSLDGLDSKGHAPIEDVILRRRSTRHYDTGTEISFGAFSTLLDRSSRGFAADCLIGEAIPLHDLYLIVNGVEGLAPGVYLHHPGRRAVELLREGSFRAEASRLAVGQWYPADAHVNAYYLTDLAPVLECYGNRGYRLAQLECSLHAGRLHLGTHTLGLGAVGSTSLDDEVTEFFSPHAAGKSFMFVNVFGRRRRKAAASG